MQIDIEIMTAKSKNLWNQSIAIRRQHVNAYTFPNGM